MLFPVDTFLNSYLHAAIGYGIDAYLANAHRFCIFGIVYARRLLT
jgi:hypothetical protein